MDDVTLHPPFFLVGTNRSGGTLLTRILETHSRIAVYAESHYYTLFRPDLHYYGTSAGRVTCSG